MDQGGCHYLDEVHRPHIDVLLEEIPELSTSDTPTVLNANTQSGIVFHL